MLSRNVPVRATVIQAVFCMFDSLCKLLVYILFKNMAVYQWASRAPLREPSASVPAESALFFSEEQIPFPLFPQIFQHVSFPFLARFKHRCACPALPPGTVEHRKSVYLPVFTLVEPDEPQGRRIFSRDVGRSDPSRVRGLNSRVTTTWQEHRELSSITPFDRTREATHDVRLFPCTPKPFFPKERTPSEREL